MAQSGDLVKVGILSCHPTTGHVRPAWAPVINPKGDNPRRTGMVMSHVWDGVPAEAQAFGDEYGVEPVEHYWDMVGQVDGVLLGDHHQIRDFQTLTRPFFEAGVPVFVNRPFAFSAADARGLVDLAARHDAPLMCGSSFEYVKEVGAVRRGLQDAERITGYLADNAAGEYAWHGVHGLWMAMACVRQPVRGVAHLCADRADANSVGTLVLEHEGLGDGPAFHGCVQPTGNQAWIRVCADGARIEQSLEPEGSPWDRDTFLWLPMLLKIQDLFQHRRMPESYDRILEKALAFLAGFKSHRECGGAPVALDEVGDWQAPDIVEPRYIVSPAP